MYSAVIAFGGPNKTSENTYVFRNYERPDVAADKKTWLFNTGEPSIAKVWEAARATSAAPLYFSKHTMDNGTYIDGGMGCNNPAELMSQEVSAIHGRAPELILSIGTGTKPPHQHVKAKKHILLDNARSVVHVFKRLPDIATESEICHASLQGTIRSLRAARSPPPANPSKYPMYFRLNVPGLGTVKLDAWESSDNGKEPDGKKTLEDLEAKTKAYLNTEAVKKNMEACAKELVLTRRERAKTERWEQFATHTTYHCPLKEEHECEDKLFFTRDQLRSHAAERHEFVPWISIQEKPLSPSDECPEDSPLCIMDQCAEDPQLFRGADAVDQLLRHLQGPAHNIKNPKPYSKPALEAYLDEGRTTLDAAFQEEPPTVPREQLDAAQQPPSSQNAGSNRTRWTSRFRSSRRSPSSKADSKSTGNTASNLAESSRERSGAGESPGRQEGDDVGRIDGNPTGCQQQQGVGQVAEQVAGAELSSGLDGDATGRNDGDVKTSQQKRPQQRQPQAPRPSVERNAVAGPSCGQNGDAMGSYNRSASSCQQSQAPRTSVEQTAGAERFPEHNGNGNSPVNSGQIGSSRQLVPSRFLPSLDHAAEHIRRAQSA
jgi:hypothetical protein